MSDFADRLRAAPDDPTEREESSQWSQWFVQHRKPPGSFVYHIGADGEKVYSDPPEGHPAWWFTSWAGKKHRSDDPAEAERHEVAAHQALDRGYRSDDHWTENALVRVTNTHTVRVERVPAMWDAERRLPPGLPTATQPARGDR
jgi:hypothetical protein